MLPWAALEPCALKETVSGAAPEVGVAVATAVGGSSVAGSAPAFTSTSSPPGGIEVPVELTVQLPAWGSVIRYEFQVAPAW